MIERSSYQEKQETMIKEILDKVRQRHIDICMLRNNNGLR